MIDLRLGDCLETLKAMPDSSIHCCVTSPPYYGLRDYGMSGQIGLEPTHEEYVNRMVAVFREVRRVLRDDGTCWVNLGDSYVGSAMSGASSYGKLLGELALGAGEYAGKYSTLVGTHHKEKQGDLRKSIKSKDALLKPKNLLGIPWRVAFALQADGWYLRQDIIWSKPNPVPESVRDRCTKSHEYIFLLTKSARYFYDYEAVKETSVSKKPSGHKTSKYVGTGNPKYATKEGLLKVAGVVYEKRNRRSVWTVATRPYSGAHFAVFPPQLIEPCILAGCPVGGTVLDPFAGSGTTGAVAITHDRQFIGIELNPEYLELARKRIEEAKTQVKAIDNRTRPTKQKPLGQQRNLNDTVVYLSGQMNLF